MKRGAIFSATIFWIVMLLAVVSAAAGGTTGRTLAREEITVTIEVPVLQRMEVVEPVGLKPVSWEGMDADEPLIVEDTGRVRVASNADWVLQAENSTATGLEVFIRKNGGDRWQPVSGVTGTFSGERGREDIAWDLKVVPPPGKSLNDLAENPDELVQVQFTLARD